MPEMKREDRKTCATAPVAYLTHTPITSGEIYNLNLIIQCGRLKRDTKLLLNVRKGTGCEVSPVYDGSRHSRQYDIISFNMTIAIVMVTAWSGRDREPLVI